MGILFRNDSGETIPAGGVMRVTGVTVVKQRPAVKVEKPNGYGGREGRYLVNGMVPVADGQYGEAQDGPLYSVYFDTSDSATPTAGELWGPVDASWKARRYVPGFRIVGLPESGQKLVICRLAPMQSVLVKTDAAHAKSASGTCSVYHGNTPGSETDSTHNITAWNRFAALATTKWARAVPVGDDDFDLVAGEC